MRAGIFLSLIACTVTLTVLSTPALATPGRTNAKGCHNSKTAGYHCHTPGGKAATKTKRGKGKQK